jgi:hypothetical protein
VLALPLRAPAERRADVLQVVAHDRSPTRLDHGVQCVAGLQVDEVGPCAEHLQGPQLAAMLVRHHVVRIVGTGPVIAKRADDAAGHPPAGDGAIRAVGVALGSAQHVVEILATHRAALAGRRLDPRLAVDPQLVGPDRDQMVLDLVVAQRPEDLVRHHDAAGHALGVAARIEGDVPRLAGAVAHREAG